MESYTVLKDTREKDGWNFDAYQKCLGMEMAALKTGDYTIKELPGKVCIERKSGVEELAMNLGSDITRFEKELERMMEFEHRYIIIECSMDSLMKYPIGSRAPKTVKLSGKYLIRKLLQLQIKYGFTFIFCENKFNAFIVAASILKRIFEENETSDS